MAKTLHTIVQDRLLAHECAGYDYNYKHRGFLNKRLLQGGVRLAGLLNRLL